jgi:hypothetical protein
MYYLVIGLFILNGIFANKMSGFVHPDTDGKSDESRRRTYVLISRLVAIAMVILLVVLVFAR